MISGVLRLLVGSGGTWVIFGLFAASVLTLGILIERGRFLYRERQSLDAFKKKAGPLLDRGEWAKVMDAAGAAAGVAAKILRSGLAREGASPEAVEERMAAARIEGKYVLERRLWVLGTLGNNAPFIGLFGTVLGVIKAFGDLASAASAGPEVVMAGLSEALVATAVGLLVAIPAVIGFNYFMKRAGEYLAETDALVRRLLAALKEA